MLIELTRGKHTVIDAADVDLAGRSWHAVPGHRSVGNYTFYAARRKGSKRITLHREILERILGRRMQEGEECDHIDGNCLCRWPALVMASSNLDHIISIFSFY